MKHIPLKDRVLVRRIEAEEVSPGGIIIPEQAQEKPLKGEVVAVGKGKRLEHPYKASRIVNMGGFNVESEVFVEFDEIDCIVGDIVIFGKYAGTEIKVDGVDCIVLREDDILLKEVGR